jgi:hypothetical protein
MPKWYNIYICIGMALSVFIPMLFYVAHLLVRQPWYSENRDYAATAAVVMVAIIIAGATAAFALVVFDGFEVTSRCFRLVSGH